MGAALWGTVGPNNNKKRRSYHWCICALGTGKLLSKLLLSVDTMCVGVVSLCVGVTSLLRPRQTNGFAAVVHGCIAVACLVAFSHRDDYIDDGNIQLLCSRIVQTPADENRRMFLNMELTEEGCPAPNVFQLLFAVEAVTALSHAYLAVSAAYKSYVNETEGGAKYLNLPRWGFEYPVTAPILMVIVLAYAGERQYSVLVSQALATSAMTMLGLHVTGQREKGVNGTIYRVTAWVAAVLVFIGFLVVFSGSWRRVTSAEADGTIGPMPGFVPWIIRGELALLIGFGIAPFAKLCASRTAMETIWLFLSLTSKVLLALILLVAQRK